MAKRARYPAGTVIDGIKVGGRFMPKAGGGDVNIYLPIRQRRTETGQFISEFTGKAQKAALVSAQMGAAAVRSRVLQEFNQRTGTLLNSIQAVPRGSTSAAIVVGAQHALWLNEGSSSHNIPLVPRDGPYRYPARYQWRGGVSYTGQVRHPGTNGTYLGFVEDSIEAFEEEIGEAIVAELKV